MGERQTKKMIKNEDNYLKQLSKDFSERYKLCNYNALDVTLFIRRLNNMGYVVVKSDDLIKYKADKDFHIKKYIVPWTSLLDKWKSNSKKSNV